MAYKDTQHWHARYPERYISTLKDNEGNDPAYPTDPDLDINAVPDYLVDRTPSEGGQYIPPELPEAVIPTAASQSLGGAWRGWMDDVYYGSESYSTPQPMVANGITMVTFSECANGSDEPVNGYPPCIAVMADTPFQLNACGFVNYTDVSWTAMPDDNIVDSVLRAHYDSGMSWAGIALEKHCVFLVRAGDAVPAEPGFHASNWDGTRAPNAYADGDIILKIQAL